MDEADLLDSNRSISFVLHPSVPVCVTDVGDNFLTTFQLVIINKSRTLILNVVVIMVLVWTKF